MIQLGKINTLTVKRLTSVGAFVGDESQDILLPKKYLSPNIAVDSQMDVFVYKDSENRWIATTLKPYIFRNEFACLRVKDINKTGAFLDWGIEKDLLIPYREQNVKMQVGKWYIVYLYEDSQTERLVATTKISKYLQNENIALAQNEAVNILIAKETDLGYNVIINNQHWGLLYKNEIFKRVFFGDKLKAYVKNIRPDQKIDVSLDPQGMESIEPNAQQILEALKKNKGFLPLHDQSSPEEIKQKLQMSKKAFKKAIGSLYKQQIIDISDKGIKQRNP
ncbi:MAG: S1-like domain-containing RNA-binding protein [Chitinophagales bacterium]|nr:GntR family transcriptional regulator [Bacteroidota bacterium]MCB9043123.1 GntR family transcriptional regulator [Chitinophagales bacterium]